MQPPEMTSLKGLSHEISHHFLGGAPFNLYLLHVDPVSNKKIPDFQFDEEKIKFLLDNTDQLISLLTKEQINLLVDSLKENHDKIEETIEELKKSKNIDNNN